MKRNFLVPPVPIAIGTASFVPFSGRDRYNGGIPIVIGTGGMLLKR